jgi:cell shape-determining protein MreC
MKMNYEHKSKVNPRRLPTVFKVISITIVILLILRFFLPNFLPNLTSTLIGPFWQIGKEDNPLDSTAYHDVEVDELRKENESLKSMLNRSASSTVTLAYILKKPPFTAYDSFIIDVGSKQKIKVGEKVYAPQGILIGEIAEVDPTFSKVKLYSTSGEKYEVLLGVGTSTENIQVTATGRGGGSFEISIPKDMKVKIGEPVTIPNLSSNIFGIVKEVKREESKTFSTILFSQPINIYQLKWVELHQQ